MHIEGSNPGLVYHFLSPEKSEVSPDQFKWKIGDWDMCSEDCAGGNSIVHHDQNDVLYRQPCGKSINFLTLNSDPTS